MVGHEVQLGHRYALEYRARDLGYGEEEGGGDYIAIAETNLGGGMGFEPVDGGESIYLFEDEILSLEESEGLAVEELDFAGQRLLAAHSSLAYLASGANGEVLGALDTVREIAIGLRGI